MADATPRLPVVVLPAHDSDAYRDWRTAIEADPLDWERRAVFADWLDEHGDPVRAFGQRWQATEKKSCYWKPDQLTRWGWAENHASYGHSCLPAVFQSLIRFRHQAISEGDDELAVGLERLRLTLYAGGARHE